MFAAALELIPKWVWAAVVAALAATSCKLTVDLGSVKLELEKSKVVVAERDTAIAKANTAAAMQLAVHQSTVLKAQNDAKARESTLRAVAITAVAESNGLRDDIATLRVQLDQVSRDAAIERAIAIAELLAQCSRDYQWVSEKADRHANDVRTLIEAWPK